MRLVVGAILGQRISVITLASKVGRAFTVPFNNCGARPIIFLPVTNADAQYNLPTGRHLLLTFLRSHP